MVRLPLWSARLTACTYPPRTGPRKFVFDSIVAVPLASGGRLRNARNPPAESASDIKAPPCRTPPAVHLSALHASCDRTSSGDAETISIPRNPVCGAAAETCAVSSGSAATGREATLAIVAVEVTPEPLADRTWWLRAPLVLVAPRPIFAALREDDEDASDARQEPLV